MSESVLTEEQIKAIQKYVLAMFRANMAYSDACAKILREAAKDIDHKVSGRETIIDLRTSKDVNDGELRPG